VDLGRVLDHDHVITLRTTESEFPNRCRAGFEEPGSVIGIHPRARHDLCSVEGSEIVLELTDDPVELLGVEHPAFDEHSLDCSDARLDRSERLRTVRVIVTGLAVRVVAMAGHRSSSR
jgi:hypothetical protein